MTGSSSLVWFRNDLRIADHSALVAAISRKGSVIPVFIWAPEEDGLWTPGAASRWWLHHSLNALDGHLKLAGSRLIIRRGPSLMTLLALAKEVGAKAVFWNQHYEPATRERDRKIQKGLTEHGLEVCITPGSFLHEPGEILNKSRRPFQVFTPFWRACLESKDPLPPLPAPTSIQAPSDWPKSLMISELELDPCRPWTAGLQSAWHPGPEGTAKHLLRFLNESFGNYATHRDRPDLTGTSRLSPHLHFGEITPRQIWDEVRTWAEAHNVPVSAWRHGPFLREIGWREFAHQLLFHFPHTPENPLRSDFSRFPWRENKEWLKAWQKGQTGYPLVDAGMRELWATGWMHNRVRMVVASFLVKDLLLSWHTGASFFWDTLVDADLANNTLGWQWAAGCGADAAPYFRIFNPTNQSKQFDPSGVYIRRWIPELSRLPDAWIHEPWRAPERVLTEAGVRIDGNYPHPIVSHTIAREIALEAFQKFKKANQDKSGE